MKSKVYKLMATMMVAAMLVPIGVASAAEKAPTAKSSKEPIKVGSISWHGHPTFLSGANSVELAAEEINKMGGILGRPVKVITEDCKHQVPLAAAALKKLVMTDRVLLVEVCEGSEITIACQAACAELYREYPSIMMAGGASSLALPTNVAKQYDKFRFFFDTFPNIIDCHWGIYKGYIPTVIKPNAKKAAIISEEAEWTLPHRRGDREVGLPSFKELFKTMGIKVVYEATTATGEKMFLPVFEKIAASGAEWIEFIATHSDIPAFAKQWAASAAKDLPVTLWGGHNQQPAFWGMTDGAALGTISFTTAFPIPYTDLTIPYLKRLAAKYNISASYAAYAAYEAIYLLKAAAEQVGSIDDVDALIKAMEKIEVLGVTGNFAFKPQDHQVKFGYPYITSALVQWQGEGDVVVVYPPEIIKRANPSRGFISPKELRIRAGKR
jgi:branched-chain amino acid transport system substrate-binding protein